MSTFSTDSNIDHVAGKKVKNIIGQYLNEEFSEELIDKIIIDIEREFGKDHPCQVNLDTDTNNIEVIVEDRNGKYIKCSSLTLFPK